VRGFIFVLILGLVEILTPRVATAQTDNYVVYSVYQKLNLGNADEVPQKDYYVNMGSNVGLKEGSVLEVMRKVSSYDLLSEQLYRDLTFPIAQIKVIHVEPTEAIARLEKFLPAEKTPAITPRAIMVGDSVREKASP
jgi:hypothetical protein